MNYENYELIILKKKEWE